MRNDYEQRPRPSSRRPGWYEQQGNKAIADAKRGVADQMFPQRKDYEGLGMTGEETQSMKSMSRRARDFDKSKSERSRAFATDMNQPGMGPVREAMDTGRGARIRAMSEAIKKKFKNKKMPLSGE